MSGRSYATNDGKRSSASLTKVVLACNCNMAVIVFYQSVNKYLAAVHGMHPVDFCLIRQAQMAAAYLLLAYFDGIHVVKSLPKRKIWFLMARCLTHNLQFVTFVVGIKYVPVVVAVLLVQTAPIWTAFLGFCVNGEKFSLTEMACILGSFVGAAMLTSAKPCEASGTAPALHALGILILILSAFCLSSTIVLTRRLQGVHFSVVLFWYSFTGALCFGTVRALGFVKDYALADLDHSVWQLMALICLLSVFSQYFQVYAQQNGKSIVVAMLGLCQPVYALFADIFVFKETFNAAQIKAGLVIAAFTAAMIIVQSKPNEEKKEAVADNYSEYSLGEGGGPADLESCYSKYSYLTV